MAHCLPPTGLCQRQKNQGADEAQESVRGEPSLVIVPFIGNLDTISIPRTSSTPPLSRRRGRRRGITWSMIAPPSPVSRHPLTLYWGTHGRAREPHRPAPVSSMHGHTLSRPLFFFLQFFPLQIYPKIPHCIFLRPTSIEIPTEFKQVPLSLSQKLCSVEA